VLPNQRQIEMEADMAHDPDKRLISLLEELVELIKPISAEFVALGKDRVKALQRQLAEETAKRRTGRGP
jgi:hypothetical protein